jgi:hypothetical protein
LLVTAGFALQCAVHSSIASITAYEVPAGAVGNQNFGGSLGMDFDVQNASGIVVDRLGVFDSGTDGLNVPIEVAVYDRVTGALASAGTTVFAAGATGTLEGGSRFLNLAAPLSLPAGFQGSIVAWGYGNTELNGNLGNVGFLSPLTINHGGAKLQFVGSSRWGNAASYPTNIDAGPANRYAAGTFSYNANPSIGSMFSALSRPVPAAGVQAFGGALGIDFVVNGPGAIITSLGAFDSNGDGILNAGITTQLWQRNNNGTPNDPADDTGTLITSDTFSAASPGSLQGSYRYKDIAGGLSLASGDYTIVAYGYDAVEMNGNGAGGAPYTDDGNGLISFVGRSRFGITPGAFPDTPDAQAAQYMAGSFQFTAIPEPAVGTFAALAAGAAFVRRRKVSALE